MLDVHDFYRKGNRLDSSCKQCKKQKSKTTYVSKKNPSNFSDLNRFIDLVIELDLKRLTDFERYVNQLIQERNSNEGTKEQILRSIA